MPCYATGSAEGDAQLSAQEARKEATKVTALLCMLCQEVEEYGCVDEIFLPTPVRAWWKKHKKIDQIKRKKVKKVKCTSE